MTDNSKRVSTYRRELLAAIRSGQASVAVRSLAQKTSEFSDYAEQLVRTAAKAIADAPLSSRQRLTAHRVLESSRLEPRHQFLIRKALLEPIERCPVGRAQFPMTVDWGPPSSGFGTIADIVARSSVAGKSSEAGSSWSVVPLRALADASSRIVESARIARGVASQYLSDRLSVHQACNDIALELEPVRDPSGVDEPLAGDSFMLAAAVAVVSDLLKHPVFSHVAFTGGLYVNGELRPDTRNLDRKVQAADDLGVEVLWMQTDVAARLGPGVGGPRVRHARRFDEVADALFGWLIEEKRKSPEVSQPEVEEQEEWIEGALVADVPRIVTAFIAPGDPRDGRGEGPLLTVARCLQPSLVYVLMLKDDGREQVDRAEAVTRNLEIEGKRVRSIRLNAQTSEASTLECSLAACLDEILRSAPGARLFAVTSNTDPDSQRDTAISAAWRRLAALVTWQGTLVEVGLAKGGRRPMRMVVAKTVDVG